MTGVVNMKLGFLLLVGLIAFFGEFGYATQIEHLRRGLGETSSSSLIRCPKLRKTYGDIERDLNTCLPLTEGVHKAVDKVNDYVGVVEKTVTKVETVSKTLSTAIDVQRVILQKVGTALQKVPKIGQLVKICIDIFNEVQRLCKEALKRIEPLVKVVKSVSNVTSTVATVSKYSLKFHNAAITESVAMGKIIRQGEICVENSNNNDYKKALEAVCALGSVRSQVAADAAGACADTAKGIQKAIDEIRAALDVKLLNDLHAAFVQLQRELKPVFDFIESFNKWMPKFLADAYCCYTPPSIQAIFAVGKSVVDIATCPIQGSIKTLDGIIKQVVISASNAGIKQLNLALRPLQKQLAPVRVKLPVLELPQFDAKTCKLSPLGVNLKEVAPFDTFVKYRLPKEEEDIRHIGDFAHHIATACSRAAEDAKSILTDCCRAQRPQELIADGNKCSIDPHNVVSRTRCSMCSGVKHSWDHKQVSYVCGQAPCTPDGVLCDAIDKLHCTACCNPHSVWTGEMPLGRWRCGTAPRNWEDGTVCVDLPLVRSCKDRCKSGYFETWYSKVPIALACGAEPRWPDGTVCVPGVSCQRCQAGFGEWWVGPGAFRCGREPCWPKDTVCVAHVSCHKCCKSWNIIFPPPAAKCT